MGVLRVLGRSALAWDGENPDSCLHMSDFPLLAFVSYGRGTLRRKWQKTCLQAFLGSPVFHGSLYLWAWGPPVASTLSLPASSGSAPSSSGLFLRVDDPQHSTAPKEFSEFPDPCCSQISGAGA